MDGVSITYDAIGNPTSYYNGTSWTMGWDNGRNLVSASGGGKSITYGYSLNGLRTSKTVGGVTHNLHFTIPSQKPIELPFSMGKDGSDTAV